MADDVTDEGTTGTDGTEGSGEPGESVLDLSAALIVDRYEAVAGAVSGVTADGHEGRIDALVLAIAASDDDGNQVQHHYVLPLKAGMDLSLHINQAIGAYLTPDG